MRTLNVQTDRSRDDDDDDDDFADFEARPLLGWFLMAVALVTMAFLIGGRDDVSSAAQAHKAAPEGTTTLAMPARTGAAVTGG